jgi:hypothetical protein
MSYGVIRGLLVGVAVVFGLALCASLGVRTTGAMRLSSTTARFEKEVGSLSLLDFVKQRIPQERNAVTWIRPGVLAVVLMNNDRAIVGTLATKPTGEWTAKDFADLQPLLERNEPAFTLLRRAQGMPESNWEVPYEQGNEAKLPDLLAAMNAGKLLAARGRAALARGDRETAIASAEILGTMAGSYEQEPAAIILLIGSALERQQLGIVREIVMAPGVEAGELDRLERSLPRGDLDAAFRNALRGASASLIKSIHSEDIGKEFPRLIPRGLVVGLSELLAAQALDESMKLEPSMAGPIKAPLPDAQKAYEDAAGGGWWRKAVAAYGPNIGNGRARGTATLSARMLAQQAIGLRRAALETGRYPAKPGARVDPLSGEPFVYDATADGVARLRSTTTPEILKSIYTMGSPLTEQLYSWTLPPASSRSTTPPLSPAGRKAASS